MRKMLLTGVLILQVVAGRGVATAESGGIRKCIDASGSAVYTQTECPDGTKPVEAPRMDTTPQPSYYVPPKETQKKSDGPARPLPHWLLGRLREGDEYVNYTQDRVACPGNPYSIRKPDRTFERYTVEIMVTASTIKRANGTTEIVYQDEFRHSDLMKSREDVVIWSCNTSVEERTKDVQAGRG